MDDDVQEAADAQADDGATATTNTGSASIRRRLSDGRRALDATRRRASHATVPTARGQMTAPSLKIGRYIATTRPPMTTPRNTMMIGSSRLDSAATASSTSRS